MLLATTKATIRRPNGDGDPYEAPGAARVSTVDAHISGPTGTERNVGGAGERIDAVALLPLGTDVRRADRLTDVLTCREYRVGAVMRRTGLGLDHVAATLVAVAGEANG